MNSTTSPSEGKRRRGRPPKNPERFSDAYCQKAHAYARDVASGKVPASKWTVLGAKRFLRDLDRELEATWPYRLDEAKASRVCKFHENLPHVQGPLFGKLLKLEPWQCFVLVQAYGWVKKSDGLRRFRRAQVWVPRGNGKSFLASGCALYGFADGEGGAQILTAATTREQARIVLDFSRKVMDNAERLRGKMGLEVTQHAILQEATNSAMRSVSSEAKTLDGRGPHVIICDELHAHATRDLFDVLVTGMGKRTQPMMWIISTAGADTSGIGYEQFKQCRKILEGTLEDERTLACMWEADEGDDPWSEATWRKANPNFGVSVDPEHIAQEAATAKKLASARSAFFTKHLNQWVGAREAFVNLEHWDHCVDPEFSRERLADGGDPVWVGMDLASKKDLTCIAYVWRKFVEGEPHYWIAVDSFLPEEAVNDSGNSSYRGWVAEGFIRTNEGNEIEYPMIKKAVLDARDRYSIQQLAFDNYQPATVVAQELAAEGIQTVEVRGTFLHMNPAMREFEAALAGKRIHLEANPCLRWMASNVIAKRRGDEIRPEKEHDANKIDGVVAVLMALKLCAAEEVPYLDGAGFQSL